MGVAAKASFKLHNPRPPPYQVEGDGTCRRVLPVGPAEPCLPSLIRNKLDDSCEATHTPSNCEIKCSIRPIYGYLSSSEAGWMDWRSTGRVTGRLARPEMGGTVPIVPVKKCALENWTGTTKITSIKHTLAGRERNVEMAYPQSRITWLFIRP